MFDKIVVNVSPVAWEFFSAIGIWHDDLNVFDSAV